MKKSLLIAVLLATGCVTTSQAVIISWAATTTDASLPAYTSAALVYVSNGNQPTYQQISGLPVIGTASGAQLVHPNDPTPYGVRERTATGYGSASGDGAYYVVLFNADNKAVAVSVAHLGWQEYTSGAITTNPMNPATGVFNPSGTYGIGEGHGWTPVPEPGTLALVGLGAAALVIRRRRMRK